MNIVFVHLQEFPRYVLKNINYTSSTFTSHSTHLLIDQANNKRVRSPESVQLHIVSKNRHEQYLQEMASSLSHDWKFRDGFWYLSVVRLLHFFDYVIEKNLQDVLLIESDVLILPNFPFEKLVTWGVDCAYPLATLDEGVASVLFCKNSLAAMQMKHELLFFLKNDPSGTDCRYLGFLSQRKPKDLSIGILPTAPSEYFPKNQSSFDLFQENFNRFGGVFDASTLGLYFLGIDLRNTNGIPLLRKYHDVYPIRASDFSIHKISGEGEVNLRCNEDIFPIFNFHIHTKFIEFFSRPVNGSKLYQVLTEPTFHFPRSFLYKMKIKALIYRIRVKLEQK